MKRYLTSYILKDLDEKIILLSGPRQVGKTTLSKMLSSNCDYLNYDRLSDRKMIMNEEWDREKDLLILDEIHKMKRWKQWLKGIYDTEGLSPKIIVTGSAKMDTYKKMGDSLAGRHFSYSLHPLDIKECTELGIDAQTAFDTIWQFSGFPEPFLKQSASFYGKWQRSHMDLILRQDFIETTQIHDIKTIELLIEKLKGCVGSSVSFSNLAQDLHRDPKTIKRWITELENAHVIFSVYPFSKNIARSIQKQPKFYFYDIGHVSNDAAKLENLVALSLLKSLNFNTDTRGERNQLRYIRTTDNKEIDFAIEVNHILTHLIEVKWSDPNFTPTLKTIRKYYPSIPFTQLVLHLDREKTTQDHAEIRKLVPWLAEMRTNRNVRIE